MGVESFVLFALGGIGCSYMRLHALAMEGDTMVRPLIFTTEDLFTKVSTHDWYRKKVQAWGRY